MFFGVYSHYFSNVKHDKNYEKTPKYKKKKKKKIISVILRGG